LILSAFSCKHHDKAQAGGLSFALDILFIKQNFYRYSPGWLSLFIMPQIQPDVNGKLITGFLG
jgi:hypothetical protein